MYKLSPRERLLLAVVELGAQLPYAEIARRLKTKEHTARYALLKLQEENIISLPRPIIDWNRLGIIHHSLFFSLGSKGIRGREKLLKVLHADPEVSWIFELGGEFHFGISLSVRDVRAMVDFLKKLSVQFGDVIFSKSLTTQVAFHYYGRRYFSPNIKGRSAVNFCIHQKTPIVIDEVDQAIIKGLTTEQYRSLREFSNRINIPHPTVDRRVRSLEQRGVIRGYFHWIDTDKLGVQRFVLLANARGLSSSFMTELLRYAEEELNVVYLTECIGEWDFEIGIEVDSSHAVSLLTQRLYERLGDSIQSLNVIPILKYFKYRNYLLRESLS